MDTNLSNADASFWGEDSADRAGWSVSNAGDVDKNGYDDILIGAYSDEDGGYCAGQTYLMLGAPPAMPYVVSSDASGAEWNTFDLSDDVYCYAGNLPYNDPDVDIYVVPNAEWSVGDSIGPDVSSDGVNTASTDSSGNISTTLIWPAPLTAGDYDIIVDLNQDGFLNASEPVDDVTLGEAHIPHILNKTTYIFKFVGNAE